MSPPPQHPPIWPEKIPRKDIEQDVLNFDNDGGTASAIAVRDTIVKNKSSSPFQAVGAIKICPLYIKPQVFQNSDSKTCSHFYSQK